MAPSILRPCRVRAGLRLVPGSLLAMGCVVSLGTLAGCDREAAERNAAARDLNEAIAVMQRADATLPTDAEYDAGLGITDVRLKVLEDGAVEPLRSAIGKGSAAQKAEASKLLARIESQAAEHLARQAANDFATLRVRMTSLLGTLDTVDTLGATAEFADRDPAKAIAILEERSAELQTQKQALAGKVVELQARSDELSAMIAEQNELAKQAFAERSAFDSAAFVQTGDEMYDTLNRAAQSQSVADAADVEASQLAIALAQVDAKLELARADARMTDAALEQLADTKQRFADSGQDARVTVRELRDQQRQAADKIVADVQSLVAEYTAKVGQPMTAATERAAAAVETLESASGPGVAADLMDKRLLLAQTLANAAMYAAALESSIDAMAGRSAFAAAPELRQRLAAAAAPLEQAAASAKTAAADAVQAAQQDLSNADPDDALATTVRAALTRLAGQVGAPAPAPVAVPSPEAPAEAPAETG